MGLAIINLPYLSMLTDASIRKLFRLMNTEPTLSDAAKKAGVSEKTARKYARLRRLPSDVKQPHTWRTRRDPFQAVWPEVVEKLQTNPNLQATTLFQDLQRRYPGQFGDGQLRTFQRRIRQWKAQEGPPKEVRFHQTYVPGECSQSDFTRMNALNVTIQGTPFPHLLFHFVLPYSHWEAATVCISESFESLSTGLQNALASCGGVPRLHQTDSLRAAVRHCTQAGEAKETFTERYQALMRHYGMQPRRTQPGRPHENGAIEQRHYRLKKAVADALSLRGSADFAHRAAYEQFIATILKQLNATRVPRFRAEVARMNALPRYRLETFTRRTVRVSRASTISVQCNAYSVQSRLIGEQVEVRMYPERLEIWYAQRKMEEMPRLQGQGRYHVQYPHMIDWLVRKPGAFPRFRYRDAFFPTHLFRIAYDRLQAQRPTERAADKAYLCILHLAAQRGERQVEAALQTLLDRGDPIRSEAVEALMETPKTRATAAVTVEKANLVQYDALLADAQVHHATAVSGNDTANQAGTNPPQSEDTTR